MKKQNIQFLYITFTGLLLFLTVAITSAQVGINTITPANGSILDIESSEKGILIPRMDIIDLTTIDPVTGIVGPAEEAEAEGLMVYNTFAGTGTGFHFWNGTDWVPVSSTATSEPPIDAVTLTRDLSTTSTSYIDVTGMSLSFTARKTSALINLTASGFGNFSTNLHTVYFRVNQTIPTPIASLGGTKAVTKSRSATAILPEWNASFSKLMTGLTVGVTYTLQVQWSVGGTAPFAEITAASFPDEEHLTLSVMQ